VATVQCVLPEAAYAAAIAAIPTMGPARLRQILTDMAPSTVWATLGSAPEAAGINVEEVWNAERRLGIDVLVIGGPGYPEVLASDPEAPGVLFALGDVQALGHHPNVAIVGTRSATRYGLSVAAQLGSDLTAAGVSVISGLALGIDGAAHEGATGISGTNGAAPPIGVVAGGLDSPYPRSQAGLWRRVADAGVLISESVPGAPVPKWRFPQRNRVIAAMADVVVVVECHAQGGALHTVRAAERRGITVGAVPGSVRSPASAGTNDLLADGAVVIRDVGDVLVAVGLARAGDVPVRATTRPAARSSGSCAPEDQVVLSALEWEPSSIEQLLDRTGGSLASLSLSLERLRAAGLAQGGAGWWQRD